VVRGAEADKGDIHPVPGDGAAPDVGTEHPGATDQPQPDPLESEERRQLDLIRRLGTVGALLLAAGSLGAGASPVFNPVLTMPLFGLFTRIPTVALASAMTGMGMIILAWLWLGRFVRPGRARLLSRTQLDRTLMMWLAPLVIVLPMFSRDVYSYLAQSKITALGLDPYHLGPASALGVDDPLTRGVSNLWRETPAPYGPLFLTIGRGISLLIGDHVVTGTLLHRLLELIGVALMVWALPRLARRYGVQPVAALWLGAANPLVIWHLVIGSHNEALMIGLMLAGFELALRGIPRIRSGEPRPPVRRSEIAYLLLGVSVILLGAAVKITALPALGFLGMLWARRLGGKFRHFLVATATMSAIAFVVLAAVSVGTGLGFGWISATISVPGVVKSWMSPMTTISLGAGGLGLLLGTGNHIDAAIDIMRAIGTTAAALVCVKLLIDTFRAKIQPLLALGLCLSAVVVFGATVQPWYLLWAIPVLAAATTKTKLRSTIAGISVFFAVIVPPTGSTFDGHVYVVPEAYLAAIVVLAVTAYLLRNRIPLWPEREQRKTDTALPDVPRDIEAQVTGKPDAAGDPDPSLPTASR
jgi:alpha-1,6-mannosyltransferase